MVAYGWFDANLRTIWQREGIYTTSFEDEPKGLEALQGLLIREILRFQTEIALAVSFGVIVGRVTQKIAEIVL